MIISYFLKNYFKGKIRVGFKKNQIKRLRIEPDIKLKLFSLFRSSIMNSSIFKASLPIEITKSLCIESRS